MEQEEFEKKAKEWWEKNEFSKSDERFKYLLYWVYRNVTALSHRLEKIEKKIGITYEEKK